MFNCVALDTRFIRCAEDALRAEPVFDAVFFDSFCCELTDREDAVRGVVERRFCVCVVVLAVVLLRGITACLVVVRETVFCCGCVAVVVFRAVFWVLSFRFGVDAVARLVVWVVVVVVAWGRFDAARTVVASSANVVWNTDKPRHTAKNSIILFIP